jgi:nucleoid-associated protein YejK
MKKQTYDLEERLPKKRRTLNEKRDVGSKAT